MCEWCYIALRQGLHEMYYFIALDLAKEIDLILNLPALPNCQY